MSISARITYVQSKDLVDEPMPTTRAPEPPLGRARRAAGLALAALGLPLLTLALHAIGDGLSLEGEVLLYLLAVVAVALIGGLLAALPAAVAAALLINYFFVSPLHTFDVARSDQAVALGVFVAVAAIVSGAVELAGRRARAAERAAAEAETLSALAGADLDEARTLHGILDRARRTLEMESVTLLARDGDDWHAIEHAGWVPEGRETTLRFDLPIRSDLRLQGRGPALFAEDQRVLQAFAAAAETAYDGRRLAEQAREARSLATVDRQRTALLAAVGHDLRTPLAGIKAGASSLRQTDVEWTPEEREELLATIEDSADRLDAVVANLLDASRLQAGALSVRAASVALDEVVAAAVLAVPGAHGRVAIDVPEDLPLVRADPGLLERVLANLIDNGLRHGGEGMIEIAARAGAESAKLTVVDHGAGVAPEERDGLFVPFRRFGDQDAQAGVGLGLSVARGFTEAMGGALAADESPGGGLTMRLRLPLAGSP
jgi:two-component system sensor histidine kinase KdpD